ncbi:hypothetical protein EZS27_026558 [termite gut metagenome]|uniref:Uncharacterized protein n=1 Tax=termite gut metagenome TaxID=433724 RepID=A0A5J4QQ91_9ZZZZ
MSTDIGVDDFRSLQNINVILLTNHSKSTMKKNELFQRIHPTP